jgi:hypothetical protein
VHDPHGMIPDKLMGHSWQPQKSKAAKLETMHCSSNEVKSIEIVRYIIGTLRHLFGCHHNVFMPSSFLLY